MSGTELTDQQINEAWDAAEQQAISSEQEITDAEVTLATEPEKAEAMGTADKLIKADALEIGSGLAVFDPNRNMF